MFFFLQNCLKFTKCRDFTWCTLHTHIHDISIPWNSNCTSIHSTLCNTYFIYTCMPSLFRNIQISCFARTLNICAFYSFCWRWNCNNDDNTMETQHWFKIQTTLSICSIVKHSASWKQINIISAQFIFSKFCNQCSTKSSPKECVHDSAICYSTNKIPSKIRVNLFLIFF